MKGVRFGEYYSCDYGIILSSKTIEAPLPKTETIDIPGSDGVLDITEYFGEVRYNNRKLAFVFSTWERGTQLLELFYTMTNELSGRWFDSIILDDDPEYMFRGRVKNVTLSEGKINTITVECDCEPYREGVEMNVFELELNHLPFEENYGDPNRDGVTDLQDATYIEEMAGYIAEDRISDITALLKTCDLNFDGTIDTNDARIISNFLLQDTYTDIRDYAETLSISRSTETTLDFGRRVSDVQIELKYPYDSGSSRYWELYVDDELYLKSISDNAVVSISGKHRLIFKTVNYGIAVITYPKTKL